MTFKKIAVMEDLLLEVLGRLAYVLELDGSKNTPTTLKNQRTIDEVATE